MDSVDTNLIRNICNKASLQSQNDEEYLMAVYDSLLDFSFTEDQIEYIVVQIANGIGNREAGVIAISKCKAGYAEEDEAFMTVLMKD